MDTLIYISYIIHIHILLWKYILKTNEKTNKKSWMVSLGLYSYCKTVIPGQCIIYHLNRHCWEPRNNCCHCLNTFSAQTFLVLVLVYWRYFSNHLNLHMQLLISESCFFGKYCSIQALHKSSLQTEEYSTPVHKTIVWESTITLHFNWQKNYQGYFILGSWNKPLINWCFSGYLFLYIQNTFPVFSFAWVMRVLRCSQVPP